MIEHFKSDEYAFLSNFTEVTIKLDGIQYKSVEHAFMSCKNDSVEWKEFCKNEPDPGIVKTKSREVQLIDNWDTLKIDVMRKCIDLKFNQEPFKSKLIETGTKYIQEGNWWNDKFWGVDLKSTPPEGKNMLGLLLMEKRHQLISEQNNIL